jgi:hypothetical protein
MPENLAQIWVAIHRWGFKKLLKSCNKRGLPLMTDGGRAQNNMVFAFKDAGTAGTTGWVSRIVAMSNLTGE